MRYNRRPGHPFRTFSEAAVRAEHAREACRTIKRFADTDWLASAKQAGAWVYGASPVPEAVPYDEPDYSGRVVLVLGGEGHGLRPRVAAACDRLVALPMRGRIESLNVSAAAAVLLYEILHSGRAGVDKAT